MGASALSSRYHYVRYLRKFRRFSEFTYAEGGPETRQNILRRSLSVLARQEQKRVWESDSVEVWRSPKSLREHVDEQRAACRRRARRLFKALVESKLIDSAAAKIALGRLQIRVSFIDRRKDRSVELQQEWTMGEKQLGPFEIRR